jgi:hypothetical protein
LFLQDPFREFASVSEPTFELIKAATKRYGNTMTSTLWRLVEALDIPALGIVGSHPRGGADPNRPAQQCRYFIRSRAFMERFGTMTEDAACAVLRAHSSFKRGGPIANVDVTLVDDRGESQLFHLESFYNGHEALTIFTYKGPLLARMSVSSVALQERRSSSDGRISVSVAGPGTRCSQKLSDSKFPRLRQQPELRRCGLAFI